MGRMRVCTPEEYAGLTLITKAKMGVATTAVPSIASVALDAPRFRGPLSPPDPVPPVLP
jgi:hypothetical protein